MEVKIKTKIDLDSTFWTKYKGKVVEANCYLIAPYLNSFPEQNKIYYFIDGYGIPESDVFKTRKECKEELSKRHFNHGR